MNDGSTNIKTAIKNTVGTISSTSSFVFCGPEYNGSIPPIISNTIAWISVSTEHWRDGFKDKNAFIATSSGGPG